ncbi:hypothetical protein CRYUN_Cryun36dG0068300 [Craigia yunnanensis]
MECAEQEDWKKQGICSMKCHKEFVPDVVTYNIMINICKKGMLLEADKLFIEMEEKGCLPDSISFNIIIQGFFEKITSTKL